MSTRKLSLNLDSLVKEKLPVDDGPTKEAFLKHDLYTVEFDDYKRNDDYELFEEHETEKLIIKEKVLSKGSRFLYFEGAGWYDDCYYGVEGASSEWAKKHLTKPVPIKKDLICKKHDWKFIGEKNKNVWKCSKCKVEFNLSY